MTIKKGILLDLDQTLVNSRSAENYRETREWSKVDQLMPDFDLYPGILELIEDIYYAGWEIGIITSAPREYALKVTEHFKISYNTLVGFYDTGSHKPDPEPYEKALEDMGVKLAFAYAVGDGQEDIDAANELGIISVGATWGKLDSDVPLENFDLLFDEPIKLADFLLQRGSEKKLQLKTERSLNNRGSVDSLEPRKTINEKLQNYQERLEAHFSQKRDQNPESTIYLLDHTLNSSEIIDIENLISSWSYKRGQLDENYWLVYLVFCTEIAFKFDGKGFWTELIPKMEKQGEYLDDYWKHYRWDSGRRTTREFFFYFQQKFNGIKPIGKWAYGHRYISHPVTHAILPRNLQEQLFKYISDELDRANTQEYYETPEKLGKAIKILYGTGNRHKKSQFDTLMEHPKLLGTLVFHIAELEPTTPEGKDQLVNLEKDTLIRIKENLTESHKEIIKHKAGKSYRRRLISTKRQTSHRQYERINKRQGINPFLGIKKDSDEDEWSLHLHLPRIKNEDTQLKRMLNQNRLLVMHQGSQSNPSIIDPGSLKWSDESIPIKSLVDDDEPLVRLENNEDQSEIEKHFEVLTLLGPEPWVFKIVSSDNSAKRVSSVRLGSNYLLLRREIDPVSPFEELISLVNIKTDNLKLYRINLPESLHQSERDILSQYELEIASDLIDLRPIGFAPSYKDSDTIQWVKGKYYFLFIEVKQDLASLSLDFEEDEVNCGRVDKNNFNIASRGQYFLTIQPSTEFGDFINLKVHAKTIEGEEYCETLKIEIMEPEIWNPGISHEVAFTVSFIETESDRIFEPNFEDLIENDFDMNITLPFENCGEISLALFNDEDIEIDKIGEFKIESFLFEKADWDQLIFSQLFSLDDSVREKITEARLKIDAGEFGFKEIIFPSQNRDELYLTCINNRLQLVDRRGERERHKFEYRRFASINCYKHTADNAKDSYWLNNQLPGIHSVIDYWNRSDVIFTSELNYDQIDFGTKGNEGFIDLLDTYRKCYRARALTSLSRQVRRRLLLEINSAMIKDITGNDDWYAVEKKFLRSQNLDELEEGFENVFKQIVRNDNSHEVVEKLRTIIEERNKTQVAIINKDNQEHSESEKKLISDALRKSRFNLELIDYDDDKTKLIIYDHRTQKFSTKDLVEIDELIEHTFDSSILTVKKELVDEWSIDSLFKEFQESPDLYGLSPNIIGMPTDDLKFALNIALRPGILLDEKINQLKVTSLMIELSKFRELMPVIRFMTLFDAKVLSERIKPLYHLWEYQL